jgi:DNA-binding CsgD family transcriptional regulator
MPNLLSAYADCVAALHEAALSPELWPKALDSSMQLFGASGILLTDIDTKLGTPRSIQTQGHDPALLTAYAGYYEAIDPTIAVGLAGASGTVYHLRDHFSEPQMARMEYFQDFLFAYGVVDVMATPIDYAPHARLFVSLQRRRGEQNFDSKCHPLLRQFARQLDIAKQTEARLNQSSQTNSVLASGLDAFAGAMFIVSAKAELRHQNRAANIFLNSHKALQFHSGHLRFSSQKEDAQFLYALRLASPPANRGSTFKTAPASGAVLDVSTTPLAPTQHLASNWQEPLVLLIVSDTKDAASAAVRSMQQLYGLTPAESRLVGELAEGSTLQQIAALRAITLSTLRTQLKAVFSKTGSRRQVDLVRMVGPLSPILAKD